MNYKIEQYAFQREKDSGLIILAVAMVSVTDIFGVIRQGFHRASEEDLQKLNKGVPIEDIVIPTVAELQLKLEAIAPTDPNIEIIEVSKQELESKVIDTNKVEAEITTLESLTAEQL